MPLESEMPTTVGRHYPEVVMPSPTQHHGHMATLRPLMKPEIIKKKTKKFTWYQSDQYIKKVPGPHIKEPDVLLTCNKSHCAEITHNVSSKTRKTIVERAAQLAIRVTSPNARLHSEENE
ncbi:60S ribosomal protein L32 [Myotis brandtii]|uniref:60S ribosomal protein L32 n=1 Tax=Myotis brandtii TaxID=109478 RepID=S7NDC0_MYOBR|nr:60S ribosomal protein L32 [Myotis brandtii]